jgi:hypothetical protein
MNVFADKPKREWPTDKRDFHYVIRIAECVVSLHCQVNADSVADARHQVERIPNLIEWREVSARELAEIIKTQF